MDKKKNLAGINKRNEILERNFQRCKLLIAEKIGLSALTLPPYMEKHPLEDPREFEVRKSNGYFVNKIGKTINMFASKPFKKDFSIISTDEFTQGLANDIDGRGNNITDFLKSMLIESLWFSQSHAFVDFSTSTATKKKTHHVSVINIFDILDFDYDNDGLSYLRFRTEEQEREGFKTQKFKVIKEYIKNENNQIVWNDYKSNPFTLNYNIDNLFFEERNMNMAFDLDEIPLVSFYPNTTLEKFNPDILFKNAAELQLLHFQTASRMKNSEALMTTATLIFPEMPLDDEENRAVPYSSKRAIATSGGNPYWLAPPSGTLESLTKSMTLLEDQIDDLLGDILYGTKGAGSTTATENLLNASNSNSFISSISNSLQWAAEDIIKLILKWHNIIDEDFKTNIVSDYSVSFDQVKVTALFTAINLKMMSLKDGFYELKAMNLFSQELTWEQVEKNINQETAISMESFMSITDEPTQTIPAENTTATEEILNV